MDTNICFIRTIKIPVAICGIRACQNFNIYVVVIANEYIEHLCATLQSINLQNIAL